MASNRHNSVLKYYVNGRRALWLHGLVDAAGNILKRHDESVRLAFIGLQRRAGPAVNRAVRANYNIRVAALRGKFRIETGTQGYYRGPRGHDDYLSIWASSRETPLLEFRGRWRGRKSKGATAAIGTDGGAKTYDGAFIATIEGKRAIRVRRWDTGKQKRHGRGPVRMLYGPSPFAMLSGVDGNPRALKAKAHALEELHGFYTTELRRQWKLNRIGNGR